jgi:hypothetical protein
VGVVGRDKQSPKASGINERRHKRTVSVLLRFFDLYRLGGAHHASIPDLGFEVGGDIEGLDQEAAVFVEGEDFGSFFDADAVVVAGG